MSERNLGTDLKAAISAEVVAPILLFEADFPDGMVRMWSGVGPIVVDGETWQGLGGLISVEPSAESTDGAASELSVSVSGLDDDFFDPVMVDGFQGRSARMLFGALDTETGALLGDVYTLFEGTMEEDEVSDDGSSSTVRITASNGLADLLRPRQERYTHESQQALYPGDRGLEFVATMQDVDIKWGQK